MRKVTLFLAVMTVVLALPAIAFAQSATVSGTGTLTAEGTGRAALHGSGTVTVSGSGALYIVDRGGDAQISIAGNGTRDTIQRHGQQVLRYRGFNGTATISGSHIIVVIRGRNIQLNAEGTGRAHLRGRGTYSVNGESGTWTARGVFVALGDNPAFANSTDMLKVE